MWWCERVGGFSWRFGSGDPKKRLLRWRRLQGRHARRRRLPTWRDTDAGALLLPLLIILIIFQNRTTEQPMTTTRHASSGLGRSASHAAIPKKGTYASARGGSDDDVPPPPFFPSFRIESRSYSSPIIHACAAE